MYVRAFSVLVLYILWDRIAYKQTHTYARTHGHFSSTPVHALGTATFSLFSRSGRGRISSLLACRELCRNEHE